MMPVRYIKQKLFTSKGWALLDQVVFSASSFLTTLLLARALGTKSFGAYSLIVLYLYLLLSVSNALIAGPFQVLYAASQRRESYRSSLLILQAGLCVFFGALTAFLVSINAGGIPGVKGNGLALIILVAGFLMQDFFRRLFLVMDQPRKAFILDSLSSILQAGGLLFFCFRGELTIGTGLYVIGLTSIPSVIYAWIAARPVRVSGKDIKDSIRQHLHQGKWLLATAFLQWWANNFLMATAGLFIGFSALAALRLSQTLFGVLNAVLQLLENYTLPRASALLQQENTTTFRNYLHHTGRQTLLFALPFLSAAFLFPGQILSLAGGTEYTGYAYALQGMVLLYAIIILGYPIRIAVRAMLLNREFFMAYLVSGLFSLLTVRLIVQQWQVAGVIAALLINQLLMLVYWHRVLKRKNIVIWKLFM